MKKIFVFIFLVLFSIPMFNVFSASDKQDNLYIHYFRYKNDYEGWDVWLWGSKPVSTEGTSYQFVEDTTDTKYNYGGMVAIIPITDSLSNTTEFGIIIRKGGESWTGKDGDEDRFFELTKGSDGDCHIYLVEGDQAIGTSVNDINGPSKYPKFKVAYFNTENTIFFQATENIDDSLVTISIDGALAEGIIVTLDTDKSKGIITLPTQIDFSNEYIIDTTFQSDNSNNPYVVTFDGIYGSDSFNNAFAYDGNDLGVTVKDGFTTFKLWAPISKAVILNIYESGTPASITGGSDAKLATHLMNKDELGIYSLTLNEDLHGKYYTYDVTNGSRTNKDIVDPYAKSVGVNGLRGLVVDFARTNPAGWQDVALASNMKNNTDAIIYELHVRDLTTHETWTGSDNNRGRYLGLIEENTTYQGVTTGFDHIKELGVTHVQLLPFFDYGNAIDETKQNDDSYNSFNWGYMPLNFNALEGNYSANPYDGLVRITEFKQVVQAYSNAGIRINMDVVYNHTGQSADSNFHLIVPGYYHRLTNTGAFSNGSGTGNETASERYMVNKFIVDSVLFFATEYKLGGFRFDLMALHDLDTMEDIASALHDIDDTIMVYGEPWTGGTSTLSNISQANKNNVHRITGVGAFNDTLRDGVKGSVFDQTSPGFVQGAYTSLNFVKYGIAGGIDHQDNTGYSSSVWHKEPNKTINYVTCHDNNTLYDKLYLSLEGTNQDLSLIPLMSKQANAYVLLSQGVAFIHAGDEFLRSKPLANGFDHNSYQSPDSVNQIRWNLKVENKDINNYYKGLISFRKVHSSLRMINAEDINNYLRFVYQDTQGFIAYSITNDASNDAIKTLLVLHNSNTSDIKVTLPTGNWNIYIDGFTAGNETIDIVSNEIVIPAHTSYVLGNVDSKIDFSLYPTKAIVLNDGNNPNLGLILGLSIGIPVFLGIGALAFFIIKNKRKNAPSN